MGAEGSDTMISLEDAEEYTQALGQVVAGSWRQIALGVRLGVPGALGLTTREWVENKLGGYVRLSIPERREAALELTEGEGMSMRQAADVLGVDEATVRRDKDAANAAVPTGEIGEIAANAAPPPEAEQPPQIGEDTDALPNTEPPPEPDTPPLPTGAFRCIVIDPPWPIEKIEREKRPKQGRYLDYHTWSVGEIRERVGGYIKEKAAPSGCHVYLWTTHRHLPAALRMLDAWAVRYECLMTWRKNVGITPYSWMYDTEHVLFGRLGALPVQQKGLRLWFDAPVTRHSQKPGIFYERVCAASPAPRLDLFARQAHEGFQAWGNEIELED